ncbi:MAG: squalene/phytoene synthase family protein [Pseudomonadota bacterium]|nr:squalene/phytoene synthase family protein [Pseudomonadota bacterium]MEC8726538.1 squalene/phytoene synthase family protein [Pseudomonadota bacterium]MEC9207066.1 squalene/phytoene synthase family protein [Pseudomonadota bacterium]
MVDQNNIDYCANIVRAHDYDRYFAATFAPANIRRGLFALYAFNLEIASARERVSDAMLGEIRLQWWRETITDIYQGSVRKHAVVSELANAIDRFDLPQCLFNRMIDGRKFDMLDDPPEDIKSFEEYTIATAGELVCAGSRICGSTDYDVSARQIGSIWGGVGLLRAIPFHLSQNRIYLPKDVLSRAGITSSILSYEGSSIDISPAVGEVAKFLRDKLAVTRKLARKIRPATAYIVNADAYLKRLSRAKNDVYATGLEGYRSVSQLRILQAIFRGMI